MIVGIDFSLNSTAMCIYSLGTYEYFSFSKVGNIKSKFIEQVSSVVNLEVFEAPQKSNEYSETELETLKYLDTLTDRILEKIPGNPTQIGIEGLSYMSSGSTMLQLCAGNWMLRQKIWKKFGDLRVLSPTLIKKTAGSGKLSKIQMIEKYLETPEDYTLKPLIESVGNSKPVDDLVDSFWIVETLKSVPKKLSI